MSKDKPTYDPLKPERRFPKPNRRRVSISFTTYEILTITRFGWDNGAPSFGAAAKQLMKRGMTLKC